MQGFTFVELSIDPSAVVGVFQVAQNEERLDEAPYWGSRRYQQKIFGKSDSDEITAGRQKRLHL